MKSKILTIIFFFTTLTALGQINMEDSTVQAITYWEKGEKQNYSIMEKQIKLKGSDTVSTEVLTYEVEITVTDSTENSYTVEWLYKKAVSNSKDENVQKFINITKNMKIVFKTNEVGIFLEVVNWQEIKDQVEKKSEILLKEFKDITKDHVLKLMLSAYSTKEGIESNGTNDMQQFHTFYGAQYKLGQVLEASLKVPNILGAEPFDSNIRVTLDELNSDDNNYILKATQEIDKEQLINTTFDYLKSISKNSEIKSLKREDLNGLKHETITVSLIHLHGWIINSIQTTTVNADNITKINERTITLKE
jgi:hypothetical protein